MAALENSAFAQTNPDINPQSPYNLTVDPTKGHFVLGCNPVAASNSFYFNQIGNVGFVSFSSVFTWEEHEEVLSCWNPTPK